jgi:hypothetical protein
MAHLPACGPDKALVTALLAEAEAGNVEALNRLADGLPDRAGGLLAPVEASP